MKLPALALLLSIISIAPLHAQFEEHQLNQEALKQFNSGRYDVADSLYEKLSVQFPRSRYLPEALYRRGLIGFYRGDYETALDFFTLLGRSYPASLFTQKVDYWSGRIRYSRQLYEEAAEYFSRYLDSGDTEYRKESWLYLGLALREEDDITAAKDALERGWELLPASGDLSPVDGFLAAQLYSLYISAGDYGEIIKKEKYLDVSHLPAPYSAIVPAYIGEAFYQSGQRALAEEIFQSIIRNGESIDSSVIAYKRLFVLYGEMEEIGKQQALLNQAELQLSSRPGVLSSLWADIGFRYFTEGRKGLAESYLSRVWEMRDSVVISDRVPVYLAAIYRARGELDEAEVLLDEAGTLIFPGNETVLSHLASIKLDLEKWEEAADRYRLLTESFPDSEYLGRYQYSRAIALYKQARLNESDELLSALVSAGEGTYPVADTLRMKSIVEMELGKYEEAVHALRQYLPLMPEDFTAHLDLVRMVFTLHKYELVIGEVEALYQTFPDLESREPGKHILFHYFLGLSALSIKDFSRAASILSGIEEKARDRYPSIHPYILFYSGWSRYREGDFRLTRDFLSRFLDEYPGHSLHDRASYVAGWSAYTQEDFSAAADFFGTFLQEGNEGPFQVRGIFMYGKSRFRLRDYTDAAFAFRYLFRNYPDSSYGDDSRYEYAEVLREQGNIDEASAAFRELYETYPRSPLAEEGMFTRGELYFQQKRYTEARKAFFEYRTLFPRGKLQDAALYWSGMAFRHSDEPFGAVLMWERLIEAHPDSGFRPDAIAETAEIYSKSGDYGKALDFYNSLINLYPREAASVQADVEREKLMNLLSGMSAREAELTASINRSGGAATPGGREAMLELSRLYIYRGVNEEEMTRAYTMLQQLLEQENAPEHRARATYLLGEYYFRTGELAEAGRNFIRAAVMYPEDRDLMAASMYRAAEMSALAGKKEEVRSLVHRIEQNFPASQWLIEGRKLIEGME